MSSTSEKLVKHKLVSSMKSVVQLSENKFLSNHWSSDICISNCCPNERILPYFPTLFSLMLSLNTIKRDYFVKQDSASFEKGNSEFINLLFRRLRCFDCEISKQINKLRGFTSVHR